MKDTTTRGDLAELEVATALVREGKKLLRPVSSATRYDLVIDNEDGTFTRVQCKAGILRDGRVEFRLYSISGHRQDRASCDIPSRDQVCVAGLRAVDAEGVDLPTNGQTRRVRLAREYVIGARSLEPRTLA